MSNLSLLRVMVLKEIRTTFRERAQLRGVIISVVILVIVLVGTMAQIRSESRRHPPSSSTQSATGTATATTISHVPEDATDKAMTAEEMRLARLAAIGVVAVLGFFFSMGYLISAVLSSFVGEKEAKTLEILLASPISDRLLYQVKCVSVLLPSAGIGYGLVLLAAILAKVFLPVPVPGSLLFYGLVLGLPVMLLPMLWFVGLGAAISVRAETMKGAAQVLGGVLMGLVFGMGYGLPLLLRIVPSLRAPMWTLLQQWLAWPFAAQYGLVVLILGGIAALCLGYGRISFRRDRMLT